MHVLRRVPAVAALVSSALTAGALGACATGGVFPSAGEPTAAAANAERMIGEAVQAGADSLVPDVMSSARQNLAAAQELMRRNSMDRAALKGREAAADAAYAKAAAQRVLAERERAAAKAALDAVPGGNP